MRNALLNPFSFIIELMIIRFNTLSEGLAEVEIKENSEMSNFSFNVQFMSILEYYLLACITFTKVQSFLQNTSISCSFVCHLQLVLFHFQQRF